MTRPTPPKPYESWLDFAIRHDFAPHAATELAELRADRDHWRTSQKTTQAKGELMLSELAELRATIEVLRGERDDAMRAMKQVRRELREATTVTAPPTQVITMPLTQATKELAELRRVLDVVVDERDKLQFCVDQMLKSMQGPPLVLGAAANRPPAISYTIFGAGDTTGHNPCDPADAYLKQTKETTCESH